ncbi:hypothetical protein PRBEI_2001047100 [Prionailurus iriomotensis]
MDLGWCRLHRAATEAADGPDSTFECQVERNWTGGSYDNRPRHHVQQQLVIGGTGYSIAHPHINALPM